MSSADVRRRATAHHQLTPSCLLCRHRCCATKSTADVACVCPDDVLRERVGVRAAARRAARDGRRCARALFRRQAPRHPQQDDA
eukprot:2368698-Rhodomonas_salina.4